jgi:uncharacterized protein YbjT (DUF2867 family)
MTTVVTGATGFLGSVLVTELVKRQQPVRLLARDEEKARSELGYEPKVAIREDIRLAAAWFNAGGMEQPPIQLATQDSQYASPGGVRKS